MDFGMHRNLGTNWIPTDDCSMNISVVWFEVEGLLHLSSR